MSDATGARLEPLICRACGAPVPLFAGDAVRCTHCGASVEIPPEYRALRDTAAERAAADLNARALYARLAARPSWMLRAFAGWFSPGALALGVYPAMFIAGVFAESAVASVASLVLPSNYFDTWIPSRSEWDAVVLGFVFAYAGTLLGVFGQRRVLSRGGLQAALAAKPPRLEGGLAECRMCGAPLVAKEGDIGVACQFCRADNLLVLPAPWLEALAETTLGVLRETASARDAFAAEQARLRKTMLRYVAGLTVVSPLFLLAFRQTIVERPPSLDDWPPSYALYRATHPLLVVERQLVERGGLLYPDSKRWSAADGCSDGSVVRSTLVADRCHSGTCEFRYYAALARGDVLVVTPRDIPDGASIRVQSHRGMDWSADDDYRSPRPEFGPVAFETRLVDRRRVEIRPGVDAWYRVAVRVADVGSPRSIALCIEVIRTVQSASLKR